jgi:outer membrane protein assembly factor BamD (BamD/ComL family)
MKKPKDIQSTEDLRRYLPGATDQVTSKMVEQFFRTGFREYTAGNYLRAKVQFETVLQMSPGHPLATLYFQNCERDIKTEVESHLVRGKRSLDSGKLKDAKGHYESVLRMLFRDQANPAYAEAKEQLEKTIKQMEGEDQPK